MSFIKDPKAFQKYNLDKTDELEQIAEAGDESQNIEKSDLNQKKFEVLSKKKSEIKIKPSDIVVKDKTNIMIKEEVKQMKKDESQSIKSKQLSSDMIKETPKIAQKHEITSELPLPKPVASKGGSLMSQIKQIETHYEQEEVKLQANTQKI